MPDNATIYSPIRFFPNEEQLRPLVGDTTVSVDEAAQRATVSWPDGPSVSLSRMPDDQMGQHLSGLQGFILEQGGGDGLAIRALSTLSVYGMVVEPGFDDGGRAMAFVAALTGATDGLCLLGGDIVDQTGTSLLAGGAQTPTAARVARRALVLLALSFRALLEDNAGTADESEGEALRQKLATWLERTPDLTTAAEAHELELIKAPLGATDQHAITNGAWCAEGAQVLLWALGARELPAHDEQEHPFDVARAVGVLSDGPPKLYESLSLRIPEDLDWMRRRLLGVHWRLTESRVNPNASVDFRQFSEENWFGGFDLEDIRLVEGDLAIGDAPVTRADPSHVGRASSTAMERHRAINWLVGAHPIYSRVPTPT
ncbi:MAG: DUF4272 domain-containing protein [Deltaproteobacteria bacterium]|nr:DUF4272 domain-containing protein [Deltaproteobacteria bacterium]